mgnify:CR=1 FL=1
MSRRWGVTRTVFVGRRWAVKVPSLHHRNLVRGWLANRSEWRQRHRTDVYRPLLTLGHLALVFPAANELAVEGDWAEPTFDGPWTGHEDIEENRDERKPSSWGRFGNRWLIIDFDRAWQQHDRGLIGRLYYGRQERLARRWMALPTSEVADGRVP